MSEVKDPDHYAGNGITCKEASESMVSRVTFSPGAGNMVLHWWIGAFEYLWRWPMKNGLQDLKKCRQLLDFMIEAMEESEKD